MSEIKAGDLVMVVKPRRCGCTNGLGFIGSVLSISTDNRVGYCDQCESKTFPPYTPTVELILGHHTEISRLKKIDPPATGDSLPTRKNIKEPA